MTSSAPMNLPFPRVAGGAAWIRALVLPALALLVAGCGRGTEAPAASPAVSGAADITDPAAEVARSPHGVVSTASTYATEVGARVLAEGGTAVDAAVASAFAVAVTEPSMSGIAGRASIVIRMPDGEIHGIDGLNRVPESYESGVAPTGYNRAAVPGAIAALAKAQEEHGTWPLAQVMEPAVELAREGFPLPSDEARRFASAADDLAQHEASREYYLDEDGEPLEPGVHFVQEDLARVLEAVAEEGVEVFYRGWIADSIHADMKEAGGFITRDELAAYEALPAIPVRGEYRGHGLASNFRPASGHTVIQALQTMEEVEAPGAFDLGGGSRAGGGHAPWGAVTGRAMRLALQDRSARHGTEEESADYLTSREHARERAREMDVADATVDGGEGAALWESEPGQAEPALAAAGAPHGGARAPEWMTDHTTHLSTADADGTVVALTQSLGPSMGTRLAARGLGFLYATRLGSTPGSRPSSTISPTIVSRPDGSPMVALGGAGNARIISAVIQVASRMVDHGMPLEEAMAAPRLHPVGDRSLELEEGPIARWRSGELAALRSRDFQLRTAESGRFGRVHAVYLPEGWDEGDAPLLGVAEPRWTGGAAGPRP